MSFSRSLYILLFFSFLLASCKEDNNESQTKFDNDIETNYFSDYESPKHKWGFVDKTGAVSITPKYDDAKDVWDGLMSVNFEGRWGYIDPRGNEVIPFMYKQGYSFSDDRAFVQNFENEWLLIDKSGTIIDSISYSNFTDFVDGFAVVGDSNNKGIIAKSGQLVVPMTYSGITPISKNRFIVKTGAGYGVIDANNQTLLAADYDKVYPPSDGIFRVRMDKRYSFIAADTYKPLGSISYDQALDFHEGHAVIEDGIYKVVDKTFKVVKILDADKVSYAGNNKWSYKRNGYWGLLANDGTILTPPKYDLLNRFSDDMLAFSIDDKWGFLDDEGNERIAARFVLSWDFKDGLARVIDRRGVGFVNKSGRMAVDDKFIEVRDFKSGIARFQTF